LINNINIFLHPAIAHISVDLSHSQMNFDPISHLLNSPLLAPVVIKFWWRLVKFVEETEGRGAESRTLKLGLFHSRVDLTHWGWPLFRAWRSLAEAQHANSSFLVYVDILPSKAQQQRWRGRRRNKEAFHGRNNCGINTSTEDVFVMTWFRSTSTFSIPFINYHHHQRELRKTTPWNCVIITKFFYWRDWLFPKQEEKQKSLTTQSDYNFKWNHVMLREMKFDDLCPYFTGAGRTAWRALQSQTQGGDGKRSL